MIHEFTTLEFLQLHKRSVIRMKSLVRGELNHSREPSKGYQATFKNFLTQPTFLEEQLGCHRPVDAQHDIETHISDKIWESLSHIIYSSTTEIKNLLHVFGAKPIHPKFFECMTTKHQLIDAYIDISPPLFSINRQNVNGQGNGSNIDLNQRVAQFVNDILNPSCINDTSITDGRNHETNMDEQQSKAKKNDQCRSYSE